MEFLPDMSGVLGSLQLFFSSVLWRVSRSRLTASSSLRGLHPGHRLASSSAFRKRKTRSGYPDDTGVFVM